MGLINLKNTLMDPEFRLKITTGSLLGFSVIDKFGVNPTITTGTDPEDIWEGGTIAGAGVYTYTDDAGADYYFSSSNNSDTQEIRINVLTVDSKANWNDEEIVQTLVGQTKTLLITPSGDPIVRVYRAQNIGSVDIAGIVYIYEDTTTTTPGVPDVATKIRAIIRDGNNQTLMTIYTIPTGKVGFLFKGEAGMIYTGTVGDGTNFARIRYKSRRPGEVFRVKKEFSVVSQGNTNYLDTRSFPDPIPAKTDIKVTCEEVSENMGIWSAVDILLIDEEKFDDIYLNSIGHTKRVK